MTRKKKKVFTDDEVAEYWETHDVAEALEKGQLKRVELVFNPPVQAISLRLPVPILTRIKQIASSMDIAYQALIKIWLAERVRQESK